EAVFDWLFLLLDAGQLFHNLFIQIQIEIEHIFLTYNRYIKEWQKH
ncbi:hypothetical protein EfmE1636_2530, partial [Enterococcus faecium E1636]